MAIPKWDYLERPYGDEILAYDYDMQRYVPLVEGIQRYSFVDLTKDWHSVDNAQSYLELMSRAVYTYLYKNIDSSKYDLEFKYYLSHSKTIRQMLIDIFTDTIWYNRRDGGFMMAYNSGANLNQGKLIEFGIDKALSSIAQQYFENTKMSNRIVPYNINFMEYFDTLDELKDYLLDNDLITQEQYDKIEHLNQIPNKPSFNCFMNADGDKYVFEDLKTMEKIIKKMKTVDTVNGDW